MTLSHQHDSVLFAESLAALAIRPEGTYIDGTFGRGGHSAGILAQLGERGCLIAFDQDQQAIEFGRARFAQDERVRFEHANFAEMKQRVAEKVDGILLDLGVSSPQLDNAERGFSFMQAGPLDMRMNDTAGLTLAERLQQTTLEELTWVLKAYGEEKFARRIATAILAAVQAGEIHDTLALAEVVAQAQPVKDKYKHPATRTFQALRIWVNDELGVLERVLSDAIDLLKPGGRLAVISFHSLEDRLVKHYFREQARGRYDDVLRQIVTEPSVIGLKKVLPSQAEIESNVRSRSAILRIVEAK